MNTDDCTDLLQTKWIQMTVKTSYQSYEYKRNITFLQVPFWYRTGPDYKSKWTLCVGGLWNVCGYMIIGRHKKMLSSDWSHNFQYNPNQPGHGRLLSIRKAWLLTVHQFVQFVLFVCLN